MSLNGESIVTQRKRNVLHQVFGRFCRSNAGQEINETCSTEQRHTFEKYPIVSFEQEVEERRNITILKEILIRSKFLNIYAYL